MTATVAPALGEPTPALPIGAASLPASAKALYAILVLAANRNGHVLRRTALLAAEALEVSMTLPQMKQLTTQGGPDMQRMMELMFGAQGELKIYVAAADAHSVVMAYTSPERLKAALDFYRSKQPGLSRDAGVAKVAAALPAGSQVVAYVSLGGVAKAAKQFATMFPGGQSVIPDFADSPTFGIAAKVSPAGAEGHLVVTAETLRVIGAAVAKARGAAPAPGPKAPSR